MLLGFSPLACGGSSADAVGESPEQRQAAVTPSEPQPGSLAPLADLGGAASGSCRDWSTLDLDRLPPLPPGEYVALFDAVWRRVLEQHFDPTLGCVDWSAHRVGYGRAVAQAQTASEAYEQIDALLAQLGHSHVELFPPGDAAGHDRIGPASPPVGLRWIDDALVVVNHDATDGGPKLRGATVTAIEGEPVTSWVEPLRGRTEASRLRAAIARRATAKLSCGADGQPRSITFEPRSATPEAPRTATLICRTPPGPRVTLGNLRNLPTRVDHHSRQGGAVGVLAFNVWMLPMLERVRAAMAELRAGGMKALVIDLRGNPGGVGAMVVPVARLLLSEPADLGTMRFRDFEQKLAVTPATDEAPPFDGPVFVLIDERTASTSEIFVRAMRDLGRIEVVGGQPSAGAALPSVIEQLPGGALLQLVVADYRSPSGARVEGQGIEPDHRVIETAAGYAEGDPVMAEAVRLARRRIGPPPQ